MLTRTQAARDFGTGLPLSASLLGANSSLAVHHIFPKALLYRNDYSRGDVNVGANFCFLTKQANISISDRAPEEYMPVVERDQPGAPASQWIPVDHAMWPVDRFEDFLQARRAALAAAANVFLDSLAAGGLSAADLTRAAPADLEDHERDDADAQLQKLTEWLTDRGFASPETDVEVADPDTGRQISTAEAFWPHGLQEGVGSPVVLELDEPHAEDPVAALGYRVFTTVDALTRFAEHQLDA